MSGFLRSNGPGISMVYGLHIGPQTSSRLQGSSSGIWGVIQGP